MTADPLATALLAVSDIEAIGDADWFAEHPSRRFRARRGHRSVFIVRKAGDVLLRTIAPADTPVVDDDHNLAFAWFGACYPDWHPERIGKAARKALKRGAKK